jgi:hypothetical protein
MCTLTCNSTCFDINKTFSDGCECCEDPNSTCGGTVLGTLAVGNNPVTGHGVLPGPSADWFTVTFTGNTNLGFHPAVALSGGDADLVFDIYTSCAGPSGPETCGNESGTSVGVTAWETSYTCQSGGCVSTDTLFAPIQTGTIFIKVYRKPGNPGTCNTFSLTVSN